MKEELHQRRTVTRPQLLEAVKEARAFGDLSENFEYKAAKREKNQNEPNPLPGKYDQDRCGHQRPLRRRGDWPV